MARARLIKAEFFRNEVLGHLPPLARLTFVGLWTLADREGLLQDRPGRIKVDLFPYDLTVTDDEIDGYLEVFDRHDLIMRYVVDRQPLIAITKWRTHQRPHPREIKSTLPQPPANARQSRSANLGQTSGDPRFAQGEQLQPGSSGSSKPSKPSKPSGSSGNHRHGGGDSSSRVRAHEDGPLAAAEIATQLRSWERERGKAARNLTPSQQQVINLTAQHVSEAELRKAYELAVEDRDNANDVGPVNAAFVQRMLERVRQPPRKRHESEWRYSNAGIERMASELGIVCPPGRDHAWLAEKCESVMRQRANANGAAR
jgi:hypothetical protein